MIIRRTDRDSSITLALLGDLTSKSGGDDDLRPIVDEVVTALLERSNRTTVVVEAHDLNMLDSTGVGVLVSLFKRVKANGHVVSIVGLRNEPRAVFKLLHLDKAYPI